MVIFYAFSWTIEGSRLEKTMMKAGSYAVSQSSSVAAVQPRLGAVWHANSSSSTLFTNGNVRRKVTHKPEHNEAVA
uniref:Uncharacterized protein n=1 Tax=Knipowitschia caucasica TaxID=637954 RepID=A0AAV2JH65_KNICA